jgi:hypothetical protein
MEALFLVGLCFEFGLFAYVVVAYFREKSALRSFVGTATQPERLKDVAKQLPAAYRAPATQFAGDLSRKGQLDEILSYAITKTANTPFGPGPLARGLTALVSAALVFAPLSMAMSRTGQLIAAVHAQLEKFKGTRVFLHVRDRLDPSFDSLRYAFEASALLFAGLIVVFAIHWWLNRAEAREARFVMALLETAIIARPGASAPISGRLTELIAPPRTLQLPIAAFTFFFGAVSIGWAFLWITASVKEANAADVYDVWPKADRKENVTAPSVEMPLLRGGGSPIRKGNFVTLRVSTSEASLLERLRLMEIVDNHPRDSKWTSLVPNYTDELKQFRTGNEIELAVAADQKLPMRVILDLLNFLKAPPYEAKRAYLVFRRAVALSETESSHLQSQITLDLVRPRDSDPWMKLAIEALQIDVISPASSQRQRLERDDPARWRKLSGAIKDDVAKLGPSTPPGWVEVELNDRELTYGTFLEILAALDTTCRDERDCGVPGLGLRFVLAGP